MLWAWLATIATIFVVFVTLRKIWWAPIAGLLHEGIWLAFAFSEPGNYPIAIAAIVYSVLYTASIPKWYRERKNKEN